MRRLGAEIAGALLGAAYWTLLVWLLYGGRDVALYVVTGGAVALLLAAKAARLDGQRVGVSLLVGAIGGLLLVALGAGLEAAIGGVGAFAGGLLGYVAWRLLAVRLRRGATWGVPLAGGERWGSRFGEWAGVLGTTGAVGLFLLHATAGFGGDVKLQGYDAIARPDEVVKVSAKLEKQGVLGINPDLHGEGVVFEVDGKPYGSATTGDEGIAFIEIAAKTFGVGCHVAKAVVDDEKKGRKGSDEFVLLVMEQDGEWAPCDLDHTVCATDDLLFPVQENEAIKTLPGAPAALSEVAKKIQPVFITGRDDTFMSKTRAWLAANGFPKGPVLFMDWKIGQTDVERFKGDAIEGLAKRFPAVHVGFGDLPTDARAYLRNKLVAYILRSKAPDAYPEGITPVKDWAEILELLKKDGRL